MSQALVDLKGKITEEIGRINVTTLDGVIDRLILLPLPSMALNASDLADIVPHIRIQK